MKRKATAVWNGTGKEGNGHLTTQSNVLNKTQYSFTSRFAEGTGTNPEELIAAAHAGCFTMKLSFLLDEAGYTDKTLETTAQVSLEDGVITESHLVVKGTVSGMSKEDFEAKVKQAETECPVSKALNIKISSEGVLNSEA